VLGEVVEAEHAGIPAALLDRVGKCLCAHGRTLSCGP
jgi:hypothetical protein